MSSSCPKCYMVVDVLDGVRFQGRIHHKECLKCGKCKKELTEPKTRAFDGDIFCDGCFKKIMSGAPTTNLHFDAPSNYPMSQQGDICPVCSKKVYFAECTQALGKKFHKMCFKCSVCSKALDSCTANDREGKLYCKACYGKNFGPKGYGYGVGAGALTNTQ